jgi:4-carboxymuconolactone decarboxylase
MATRHELFRKGEAVRQQLQHGSHGVTGGSVTDTVPGLRRLTTEAGFGAVWARPGLDMRYRMICTLSVLSVLQRLSQLRIYIHSALNIGIEPRAIQEVFIQAGIYGGFPIMVNALALAREIFDQRDIVVPDTTIVDRSLEELETQGRTIRQELQGTHGQQGYTAAGALGADLFRLALQYGYGEIWQRPDLDRKSRMVCALASFTALGCEPQLRGFLSAALNVGFSKEEVAEILMHTAPYSGFPRALNAVALANEVLKEP